MKLACGLACLAMGVFVPAISGQTKEDDDAVRHLPQAFSDSFNKHDGHQLAQIMSEDVDFVTVGLIWLHGRADFEKYHTRLLVGRFRDNLNTVLETRTRFIRPDVALVHSSWKAEGDRNVDDSTRPERFGLMTIVAEKRNGTWLITAVQNVNASAGVRSPEAQDISSPIVVPKPK